MNLHCRSGNACDLNVETAPFHRQQMLSVDPAPLRNIDKNVLTAGDSIIITPETMSAAKRERGHILQFHHPSISSNIYIPPYNISSVHIRVIPRRPQYFRMTEIFPISRGTGHETEH
ncbi:hypothetical protein CDAR_503681 [Caerostris darwini]|uniref:Uncharacterized protein n=1 Tax=Caerostris darwini TaxID=1538125 RepID=A0AAV4NRE7_9ARAC|nr:hypothetical protein CDAR_503681 [Caerostris darwini]